MRTVLQTQKNTEARPKAASIPVQARLLQRTCACGGSPGVDGECAECRSKRLASGRSSTNMSTIQPKLTVNQPGDSYEQEADRLAEQVMRMPEPASAPSTLLQRQANEDEGEERLQAWASPGRTPQITPQLQTRIDSLRGGGQSLPQSARSFMEPRFGYDFSKVRIHADAQAAQTARALNARAYTLGRDIVFGVGQYAPGTHEGKRLLAHELTHVVQQRISTGLPLQRQPARTQSDDTCREPVTPARTFAQFVNLIRRAEAKLISCGHGDVEDRQHILSGIYYGAEWSLDFAVERSKVRNIGFQAYVARRYAASDDPRVCLGCGLFRSLQRSQDVAGVDMGHTLIGMDARERFLSRKVSIPTQGATGLEIVTWVGDLGGATGRLALDRVHDPKATANRYFKGTDYGAASNLEGDVAAYIVASGSSSTVDAPVIAPGGTIADALDTYFVKGTGHTNRCQHFLELQGGIFTAGTLSNRSTVEAGMVSKLEGFGRWYMSNFLLQHGRLDARQISAANKNLPDAAKDVAHHFVGWLLTCMSSGGGTPPSGASKGKK